MIDENMLVEWYWQMLTIRLYDEKRSECATEFPTPQQHPHSSIEKTGRLLVVTEDSWRKGSGAGIVAWLVEEAHPFLRSPIKRLATKEVPIPYAQALEGAVIPQEMDIIRSINSFY